MCSTSLSFYLYIHIFYGRPCESKLGTCVTLGMVGDISYFITILLYSDNKIIYIYEYVKLER